TLIVGCGGMARHHLRQMLRQPQRTQVTAIVEPSLASYEAAAALFAEFGREAPPRFDDLYSLLSAQPGAFDAAFIITPHVYHHDQAFACLEAGVDVLLEKPMVMNRSEAHSLLATQARTQRTLVVAFNGSLSPRIRTAARWVQEKSLGELVSISATVWQSWKPRTMGTWRQDPSQSGGGFLFDTGAHMLNTVCDLAGEPFVEVSARLDPRGAPVDIVGVIWGRLRSGAWVSLHASGDTTPRSGAMGSDVRVFCSEGWLRTGIWGERLEVQRPDADAAVTVRTGPQPGAWETFLRIRNGEVPNPAPALLGARMACLWDAIQASSAASGAAVPVENDEPTLAAASTSAAAAQTNGAHLRHG
ncbi:MAG: Gfo/Idh/MocA family protein, partial [Caldilineaceae bacterium]